MQPCVIRRLSLGKQPRDSKAQDDTKMMPVTEQNILEAIYQGIDVVNGQLSERSKLVKSTETVLMGEGGVLDSLGLITLLVAVEDAIQSNMGTHITVLDEEALANASGPYNTVDSLRNWISRRA